jgi:hypothetical protein
VIYVCFAKKNIPQSPLLPGGISATAFSDLEGKYEKGDFKK